MTTTNQTQDSRNAPAATGREGDATNATITKKAPSTGPGKRDITRKAEQDRKDRIKPTSKSEAVAHRTVTEAVRLTENAGARWRLAADAVKAHYKTMARAEKAKAIIFGWMAEGLPEADQAALAIDKKALKDATAEQKATRKNAGTKLLVYWTRMCEYAFPKAVEKAKKGKGKAGGEGEGEGEGEAKAKSIDERALTLVTAALEYLQKNQGFSFNAVKAATHLTAARSIIGESK